ncbi:hypothetical protein ACFOEE_03280 [Pseudoalteromonas fenneropenaei]|uniref:CopL family metal-binding regulatory protein n=1 Tax=Pseudoalteromonas fenneropenaei TaxID=1737459 RepID=A0ABV7CG09_9GAMM
MRISTTLIVITMLLAVMVQGLAYAAMPCHAMGAQMHQMNSEEKNDHSTMAMQNHDAMTHKMTVADDMASMADCCKVECHCPTHACSSVHFVAIQWLDDLAPVTASRINSTLNYIPAAPLGSLYRPPILA